MSEELTFSVCEHEWIDGVVEKTTGPNILGETVSCWGINSECSKCQTKTWRRIEKPNTKL